MNILIVFGSTDGQTADIADRIAQRIRAGGNGAAAMDVAHLPRTLDLGRFDGVMVGASLHSRGYQKRVRQFIRAHTDWLRRTPSAFFSVCLSVISRQEKSRLEARAIPARFVSGLAWIPTMIEVIPGALMFSRYGWLRRMVMTRIARAEVADVDITKDTVYTDWNQVDAFADRFVQMIAQEHPHPPTPPLAPEHQPAA